MLRRYDILVATCSVLLFSLVGSGVYRAFFFFLLLRAALFRIGTRGYISGLY